VVTTGPLYITEWRKSVNLSVEDVGARMGVSRTTFWRWETEQDRLNPSKISKIAKALGIKLEQLWRPPVSRPSLDDLAEDMSKEADLLELMRIDRAVQNKRQAAQTAIDVEADREHIPAVRIERVSRRRRPGSGA
jgi:transcriptional regulator with XRE-family HTH domain